jgi:group I intron endonuclease
MENHLEDLNKAGIYKLTCINNGKVYIGKAFNIRKRLYQHKNSKVGHYLKNAIKKHGWESFDLEILESFRDFDKLKDNDFLLEREAYFIELFNSTNVDRGYNLCKYSNDGTGKKHSEETKEKMRQCKLGKPLSEEHKAKMRKPKSKETKAKMSMSQKGRLRSEETKEKMRKSQLGNTSNLGNPHTEESKEKMRQARIEFWKNKKQENK